MMMLILCRMDGRMFFSSIWYVWHGISLINDFIASMLILLEWNVSKKIFNEKSTTSWYPVVFSSRRSSTVELVTMNLTNMVKSETRTIEWDDDETKEREIRVTKSFKHVRHENVKVFHFPDPLLRPAVAPHNHTFPSESQNLDKKLDKFLIICLLLLLACHLKLRYAPTRTCAFRSAQSKFIQLGSNVDFE